MVYLFAFLRTEFLLTVCRPVNTATHPALTLPIIVIAFFCYSVSFYFLLSCLVAALLCAENLSVACRDKFFPAMRTYFLFNDYTTIFSDFLRLSFLSIGFFSLTLFCQSLHFFLFFLCLYFSKFFFRIGNIYLPNIVEININFLCSGFSHSLCFINNNLVNEFVEHQIRDFSRFFILAYQ